MLVQDRFTHVSAQPSITTPLLPRDSKTITEELKAFARKGRTAAEPVELRGVIEGAGVLLRSRFAGRLEAPAVGEHRRTVGKGARQRRRSGALKRFTCSRRPASSPGLSGCSQAMSSCRRSARVSNTGPRE